MIKHTTVLKYFHSYSLKSFLLFAMVLMANQAKASQDISDSTLIPVDPRTKIGRLENGLTYYIRHNNWPEDRACFYLCQRVGSLQESESQRGLAHFLEHMCFNGSEHFKGNAIERYCESLGLNNGEEINAFTSIEKTVYYIDNVPTTIGQEKLDSCLLILYDWANGLTLDSLEIEKERGIVHEEWRTGRDATTRIYERQLPLLYPGSIYGHRLPIGLMDVVDHFSHKELRDYYEKWYNPENQCVIIVGNIDVDRIESKIKEIFGPIKPSATPGIVKREEVPDHDGIIFSLDKDKELQDNTVFVLSKHKAYTPQDRKYIRFWKDSYTTNAALGMLNVRYSDEILKSDCPYLNAGADDDSYFVSTTKAAFGLYCTSKDSMQSKALEGMVVECRRAAEYGFTPEEYKRYQDEAISRLDNLLLTADKRESSGLAEECYKHYLSGTDISSIEDYVSIMKEITLTTTVDDVNNRMKELFQTGTDNMVIGSWSIEKEGAIYPTENDLCSSYKTALETSVTPYEDNLKGASLLSEIPSGGDIVSEQYNKELGYTKYILSNGVQVLTKKTDIDKSQILMKAYGKAGWTIYNEDDDPNIIMLNSIPFGNNGLTSSQYSKLLYGKQVDLNYNISQRTFTFTGSANPYDIETLMQLIYADFTNMTKDEAEFKKAIEDTSLSIRNSKTVPESAFSDSVSVTSVGHHPRFKILEEEDLGKVSLDRIYEMIKEQTACPQNYTFVFVGNIDSVKMRELTKRYLASLPKTKDVQRGRFIKTWLQQDTYCHFKREMETPKTMVRIEWFTESIPYSLSSSMKACMANKILNMVYQKVIREENSATYGCDASYYLVRGEGNDTQVGFYVDCTMRPERCDTVLFLIKQEFKKLSTDIDEAMFNNAKEIMLKDLDELEKTKNGFWLDIIWKMEDRGIDLFTDRRSIIENIQMEDLKSFMGFLQANSHICETLMQPE